MRHRRRPFPARAPAIGKPARPHAWHTPVLQWLTRHAQVALSSLGRLSRAPLATSMTAAVVGIALALPAGLYVALANLERLSANWESGASLSLFLAPEASDEQAQALAERLGRHPDIARIHLTTHAEALAEFRQLSGFGEALDLLGENPLPAVLVIEPAPDQTTPEAAAALAETLRRLPEADVVQVDLQWVQRFHALTQIAQRAALVLAALLSLAVLLIVGNTVRLEIQNRRDEIAITALVGATEAFVRRPFLYLGVWYGLLGGAIAWLLVSASLWLLGGPVGRLAGLYSSEFALSGVHLKTAIALFAGSALLGLGGAWLAVGRHLAELEPT